VDATTLDTPEKMRQAASDYVIFGRVKPEQKRELVMALRAQGHQVAMTGDGVNDILAMKEADCSIAMGTGSDAARQAAQVVLLDSDFSHMVEVVGEGRRDINNITRSATLFLYKNIFSLALALYTVFSAFPYPLSPNQVSLISFFNIGLPAFLLAFEPNEARQEGRFLREVVLRSMPAALTSFVTIAYLMRFAELFGISVSEVATSSMYLLSVVGYLILVAIITPQNRYRAGVFALCVAGFCLCGATLQDLFDISPLSKRATVLVVVFAFAEVGVLDLFRFFFHGVRMRIWELREKVRVVAEA
jgi:cation-transporting ATPase E